MTPTHRVTVQCAMTRTVHQYLVFSLACAEACLIAYQARGWDGTIETLS